MPDSSPFAKPGPELWRLLGWTPDPQQLQQLIDLQRLLEDWNGRVNLTRLVQGEDFWIAQVLDSLWPLLPELEKPETHVAALMWAQVEDFQGWLWRLRCRVPT